MNEATEPGVDRVTEPGVDTVTESVLDKVTEPLVDEVTEPGVDTVTKRTEMAPRRSAYILYSTSTMNCNDEIECS